MMAPNFRPGDNFWFSFLIASPLYTSCTAKRDVLNVSFSPCSLPNSLFLPSALFGPLIALAVVSLRMTSTSHLGSWSLSQPRIPRFVACCTVAPECYPVMSIISVQLHGARSAALARYMSLWKSCSTSVRSVTPFVNRNSTTTTSLSGIL